MRTSLRRFSLRYILTPLMFGGLSVGSAEPAKDLKLNVALQGENNELFLMYFDARAVAKNAAFSSVVVTAQFDTSGRQVQGVFRIDGVLKGGEDYRAEVRHGISNARSISAANVTSVFGVSGAALDADSKEISFAADIGLPRIRGRAIELKSSEVTTVPKLLGLSVDEARKALARSRLRLGHRSYLTHTRTPPGQIYYQAIRASARVTEDTAIDVFVAREKRPGVDLSGDWFLPSNVRFDLDSVRGASEYSDDDILFDARSAVLTPLNGTRMGVVRQQVTANGCASARLVNRPVSVREGMYLCVLTTRGSYSSLRIEGVGRELHFRFDTWE